MKLLLVILLVAVTALLCGFVYLSYIIFKEANTTKQRAKIYDAICMYQNASRNKGIFKVKVKSSDMESVEETDKRWWDWSCKRILPIDKYNIVKPYIKKR